MLDWKERRRRIEALPERDTKILELAKLAYNNMGFACQGAGQQNERMEIRYQQKAEQAMDELIDLLIGGASQ